MSLVRPTKFPWEQILSALLAAGAAEGWVTAHQVSVAARASGIPLNPPTAYRQLSRNRADVEYRTRDGVRRFHLKSAGLNRPGDPNAAVFVHPGTPWTSKRDIAAFLKMNAAGPLLLVDPYIAEETLDVLAAVQAPISILSAQVGRRGHEAAFERSFRSFQREHPGTEIRTRPHSDLHGRYLFTSGRGWVVDHSVQDLGNKPALILPLHLETCFSEVEKHFVSLFTAGQVY